MFKIWSPCWTLIASHVRVNLMLCIIKLLWCTYSIYLMLQLFIFKLITLISEGQLQIGWISFRFSDFGQVSFNGFWRLCSTFLVVGLLWHWILARQQNGSILLVYTLHRLWIWQGIVKSNTVAEFHQSTSSRLERQHWIWFVEDISLWNLPVSHSSEITGW